MIRENGRRLLLVLQDWVAAKTLLETIVIDRGQNADEWHQNVTDAINEIQFDADQDDPILNVVNQQFERLARGEVLDRNLIVSIANGLETEIERKRLFLIEVMAQSPVELQ